LPSTRCATSTPTSLVFKFKPNTKVASGGTLKLTADKQIFTADAATTCTAKEISTQTGVATAVTVTSSAVTGNKTILTVTMGADLDTLGHEVEVTCTDNLAPITASGDVVKFGFETSGDTTALTEQTGYTAIAACPTTFGGATRTLSLETSKANTAAGDLVFWFKPMTAVPAGGTITLTSDTDVADAIANTACTVKANDGATTIPVSDNAAEIKWTSTKILLVTTKDTAIVANKTVEVTCPNAQLATNGGTAADVKFQVETSVDTLKSTEATGYSIVAAASATWTSALPSTRCATSTPTSLVFKFKPNTKVASGGTLKLTADKQIFTADAATTCTAKEISTQTGVATAVTVTSSAVTGNKTILTVTMGADLDTLGHEVEVTCTDNLAPITASGDVVKFGFETSGDTTALTAQTGYTAIAACGTPAPTPTTSNSTAAAATGAYSTATVAITFSGYTFAAGTAADNFADLVGCAYANHVSDSTSHITGDLCSTSTVSGAPRFTYISAASASNTIVAASRRTGSTVTTALKLYQTLISQTNFQTAVASAGDASSDKTAILNEMKAIQGAAGLTFTDAQMTPSNIATATWTHSSAAVVVPSMMAMFSALLLVLTQ